MIRTMRWIMPLALLLSAMPVMAQNRQDRGQAQEMPTRSASRLPMTSQGETARSAVGQAGQRQSREQVAMDTGIEPMGRINRRIQNRVQSRIRNRIDRYYSPQANATSPFAVASEQATAIGRSRR